MSAMSSTDLASAVEGARGTDFVTRLQLLERLAPKWTVSAEPRRKEANGGESLAWVLSYPCSDEVRTVLGLVRAHVLPPPSEGGASKGYIYGAACDPALPLSIAGQPLVEAALGSLRAAGREAAVLSGWARLPGLCGWIVETKGWERVDLGKAKVDEATGALTLEETGQDPAELAAAVEAIARGRPRSGHSVLGQGTFKAGEPGVVSLAEEYAASLRENVDSELSLYASCGAEFSAVSYMHDTSPEELRDSAGCTLAFDI